MKFTYALTVYTLAIFPQMALLAAHGAAALTGIPALKKGVHKLDKGFVRAMDLLPIPKEYR